MKQHTMDFLETLLWVADNPDDSVRPFADKTIYDFSDEFVAGAEAFIDAFLDHLIKIGFDTSRLPGERSFGGNVYFSLSGHGCGFFDDRDEAIADLQEVIQKWAGGRRRFEELEYNLDIGDDGKIDLSYIPSAIKQYRDALFAVPKEVKE